MEETTAFNLGLRDVIIIDKRDLGRVNTPHFLYPIMRTDYLVARTKHPINLYKKLIEASGSSRYTIGCVLGYPPKCVDWFVNAPSELLPKCGVMRGKSFTFKCPTDLKTYAEDYMLSVHGTTVLYSNS